MTEYQDPLSEERDRLQAVVDGLLAEYGKAVWSTDEERAEIRKRLLAAWKDRHRGQPDSLLGHDAFERYLRTGKEPG